MWQRAMVCLTNSTVYNLYHGMWYSSSKTDCFLPVVHRWKGHGAAVHSLSRWRRQRALVVVVVVVVGAAQCPTLIGHHWPASVVMFTSATSSMSCSVHLGSQNAGWRARVGVGVASVVHTVRVVLLILPVTPGHRMIQNIMIQSHISRLMCKQVMWVLSYLFSGDIEPSEEAPLSRCMVCRWSGLSSLSKAIMFHSCRRFLALRTFLTSLCSVPSTQRLCSCEEQKSYRAILAFTNYVFTK